MKKIIHFLLFLALSPKLFAFSLKKMGVEYVSEVCPSADELVKVLDACSEGFEKEVKFSYYAQKSLVPFGCKICFMGDIHGSFESEFNNLSKMIELGFLGDDLKIKDKKFRKVFLGDYVDRGQFGVEVLYSLAVLKLQNWEKVFLIMGNHENEFMNKEFGFLEEIRRKYYFGQYWDLDEVCVSAVYKSIIRFFKSLPIILFIGSGIGLDNRPIWIQCCHGGFEKDLNFDEIKGFLHSYSDGDFISLREFFKQKSIDPRSCGYLWNDFYIDDEQDGCRRWIENYARGSGYLINQFATLEYCEKCGVVAVFRGHQHSEYGLKIGGCISGNDIPKSCHWSDFENGRLLMDAQKNKNGFAIHNISFPVFTFSTATQADVINMPYDCFGILTTEEDYEKWRLKPYEEVKIKNLSDGSKKVRKKRSCCCTLFCKLLRLGICCCRTFCCCGCCCCCHRNKHNTDNDEYVTVGISPEEHNDFF